jgi:hypothetical protein
MAVLESFAGHGAFEQDGFARILDLALYVGRVVPQRTDDKQHPIIKVSNLTDNFPIAWYASGGTTPKSLPWKPHAELSVRADDAQRASWRRMLKSYRDNLLLIEERMSQYVEFTAIPLQLIKAQRETEARVGELENQLR